MGEESAALPQTLQRVMNSGCTGRDDMTDDHTDSPTFGYPLAQGKSTKAIAVSML